MFWNKKKPAPIQKTSERELEMVNNLILSMENDIDQWHVTCGNWGPKLTRYEVLATSKNPVVYNVSLTEDGYSKLHFNGAELRLTITSKRRLNRTANALVEEKLIQSLAVNEETDDNPST